MSSNLFPSGRGGASWGFKEQLKYYADYFLIAFDGALPFGFIDGFVSDDEILTDEMFVDASLHNQVVHGRWYLVWIQCPRYRNRGVGGRLIEAFIELAREETRKALF